LAANRITNYIAKLMPSWLDFRLLKALTEQADAWVDDALNAVRQAYIETQDGPLLTSIDMTVPTVFVTIVVSGLLGVSATILNTTSR